MASEAELVPVVVVTGPTASGKTSIGIEIARRFGGEIVNADSMQVYRYMDVGTAKPTPEERATVPHHVFDIVDPDADYSAGRYGGDARRAADAIHGRGGLVVLVGGTGLYIRAFLEGLVSDGGANPELRDRLEREHRLAVAEDDPERL
ncbi:MAG: isopentenyl transferase family protein, partial [Myxococcota bacterium]